MNRHLAALVVLTLAPFPSIGQATESGDRVIADKMEIPIYPPLASQAMRGGEVTLRLQVKKTGEVTSVNVVSTRPDRGYATSLFVDPATRAAERSRFVCPTCEGPTFEHIVTYQFKYPPVPERACTPRPKETIPPPPPSTADSPSHVTVRPTRWSCLQT